MRAVVWEGHERMRLHEVADPAIEQPGDLILEISKTAICGSDLHLYHLEDPEGAGIQPGFTVGHEFLGTVREIGRDVERFQRGDRVLVSCTIGCGDCASCRRGLASGCSVATASGAQNGVFGFGSFPGGQAEGIRVPYADVNCFAVPEALGEESVLFLTDILPTGFLGTELAGVGPGDTVAVFGCGPVGTFAQRCAQLRGAARVLAIDLDASRLARAAAAGCIPIDATDRDPVQEILELTSGEGAASTIEAVGSPELIRQAAMATRPGGTVAVIGVLLAPFEIDWPLFFAKNLGLKTGLVNPHTAIPRLLPWIESGRLDPTEVITHRFALEEAAEAYDLFASRRDGVLKVVLDP